MNDDPSLNGEILQCPYCRADNPRGVETCAGCGRSIAEDEWMSGTLLGSETIDSPIVDLTIQETSPDVEHEAPPPAQFAVSGATLQPGATLGDRYRIEEGLGFGGMGAVYKAWDTQVDIPVALKVVRTEATADPAMTRQLDRRFKRELLLARQVTHRNVVRIHDLGEVDDVKFITMTYIDGEDLAHVQIEEELRVVRAQAPAAAAHVGLDDRLE
ncbi:MAG: hypothetical protein IFK92_05725 [Acidobacteria bacterium]|nr:hypothetical protein [Candidatus Sulfomarinibacter kjeldsenii]